MTAGKPLDQTYKNENVELVQKGCCNLVKCALQLCPTVLAPCFLSAVPVKLQTAFNQPTAKHNPGVRVDTQLCPATQYGCTW